MAEVTGKTEVLLSSQDYDTEKHYEFARNVLIHYENRVSGVLEKRLIRAASKSFSSFSPSSDSIYEQELNGCQEIKDSVQKTCAAYLQKYKQYPLPGDALHFYEINNEYLVNSFPEDAEKYLAADPFFLNSVLKDINERIPEDIPYRGQVVSMLFTSVAEGILNKISGNLRPLVYQLIDIRSIEGLNHFFSSIEEGNFDIVGNLFHYGSFKNAKNLRVRLDGAVGDSFLDSADNVEADVQEDVGKFCGSTAKNSHITVKGNTGISFGQLCENSYFEVLGKTEATQFASGARESVFVVNKLAKDRIPKTQENCLILVEKNSDGKSYIIFSGNSRDERTEFAVDDQKYQAIKKLLEELRGRPVAEIQEKLLGVLGLTNIVDQTLSISTRTQEKSFVPKRSKGKKEVVEYGEAFLQGELARWKNETMGKISFGNGWTNDKIERFFDNFSVRKDKKNNWVIYYDSDLDITNTLISSLPTKLYINGSLLAEGSRLRELPEGLHVEKSAYLSRTKIIVFPPNFWIGGQLDISETPIVELPEGFIGKSLLCSGSNIEMLPKNLRLDGDLFLDNCPNLKLLPSGLRITSYLHIEGTMIQNIPPKTKALRIFITIEQFIGLPKKQQDSFFSSFYFI